jgi:hypothetical protein
VGLAKLYSTGWHSPRAADTAWQDEVRVFYEIQQDTLIFWNSHLAILSEMNQIFGLEAETIN